MNPNIRQPWSLKTKLTLFISAIFLFSIWALAFYARLVLHKEMEGLAGEQQFSAVSFMAAQVNEALAMRLNALEGMAQEITPLVATNTASSQDFLEMHPFLQKLFNGGVFITGNDGTAIADVPLSAGRIGVNYMDRTTVSVPLKEGKSMIGRPAMGKKLGAPIFSISAPIHDPQGAVTGVIVGTINLNLPSFLDEVTANHYGKTGGYLLVAPQHRLVVTATDRRRIMTPTPALGTIPSIDRFIEGYQGSSVYWNPLGEEVLASAKGIPVAGWYLVASLPTVEAFAPLHKMQNHIFLAAILLTIPAGSLTLWTLRRMLAPMLSAVTTLATMADSNQQLQPLPIVRQDEIGKLIGGFNELLQSLLQREEALKISERRYAALFSNKTSGMAHCKIITDELGRPIDYWILEINEVYERIIGVKKSEIEGRRVKEVFPGVENYAFDYIGVLGKIALEGGEINTEVFLEATQQNLLLYAYSPLPGEFTAILTDISDRIRIQKELHESEALLRAAAKGAHFGIYSYNFKNGQAYYSPEFLELFGLPPDPPLELDGDLVAKIMHPDDKPAFLKCMKVANDPCGSGIMENEYRILHRNGQMRWLRVNGLTHFSGKEQTDCPLAAFGIIQDITAQKQRDTELQTSLAEREVLLREVHHRVKNNMAAIIGLLNLQQNAVGDPQSKTMMADLSARIRAMSLVHEKFYRSASLSKVDFHEYLQTLISHLRTSFGSPYIFCDIAAQGVEMPLDLAVPCGMIVNELIINALKYAFPKEWPGLDEARIQVAMTHDNNTFTLSVADNGVGLPPGFDLNKTSTLGFSLVQMLGRHQLGGRFEVDQTGGTKISLTFSLDKRENTYA